MELKVVKPDGADYVVNSLNCTFMELKAEKFDDKAFKAES